MKSLYIAIKKKSELAELLESACGDAVVGGFEGLTRENLSRYQALAILGGTEDEPVILNACERTAVEEFISHGKRLFCEYLLSISLTYAEPCSYSRGSRMIYTGQAIGSLEKYSILDDQCNKYVSYYYKADTSYPLLIQKDYINSHSHFELPPEAQGDVRQWMLWYFDENTLICGIKLCCFNTCRFAPVKKWHELLGFIVQWLLYGSKPVLRFPVPYTTLECKIPELRERVLPSLESALRFFERNSLLLDDGKRGVLEGFSHDIYPDGLQKKAMSVRADCIGEVSLAYLVHYLLTKDERSNEIFINLQDYMYGFLQINGGLFDGMLRWTEVAWGVCYQDDVARAIIPSFLYSYLAGDDRYIERADKALAFLVKTTGRDGLRVARTDNINLDADAMRQLYEGKGDFPCAHYNAYYHAALLLSDIISPNEIFRKTAVTGLEEIMKHYPDTTREQSETSELCRLILPLALLYKATGEEKHSALLKAVTKDLQRLKTPDGAYYEWDTGYRAACSRKRNTECSLLTQNGDPVVDMLYSINWLPAGFAFAYLFTGEKAYAELWNEISAFFISVQLHSDKAYIDGCWTRAFDIAEHEVFGVPHDIGWGPWAIETGWTMGEIASGLGLGLLFGIC